MLYNMSYHRVHLVFFSETRRDVHDKLAIAKNVFTASKTNHAVSLRLRVGQDLESIQVETVS